MGPEAILKVTSTAPDCETIKTINNGLRVALARTTNPWRPRSYKLYSLKKPNLMYKSDRTPTKRGVPRAFLSVKASLVVRLRQIAKNRPQRQTFSKAWRNFEVLPEIDSNMSGKGLAKDQVSLVGVAAIPTIPIGLLLL